MAALLKGIAHGVDAVEFDVRVTKDGVVVLHHNPRLEDRQGKQLTIDQCTYRELLAHKPDLPSFEDATKAINQQTTMIIEVKPSVPIKPVVKAVKLLLKQGWPATNILLAARSYTIMKQLHAALPNIELMVIDRWSGVRGTHRARRLDAKKLAMNQWWLWPGFIRAVSRGGYELYAYPLNNPFKASRWAKYGLAGVITDYPDRYKYIRE